MLCLPCHRLPCVSLLWNAWLPHHGLPRDVCITMPCQDLPCLPCLFLTLLALKRYDLPCMLASQCLHCHALPICQYVWCSSSYLRHETENTEQLWLAFNSLLIKSFVAASVILGFLWRTYLLLQQVTFQNCPKKNCFICFSPQMSCQILLCGFCL